ncbi:hypothetical protein ACVPOW_12500 [Staphylococcus aureus]
MNSIGTLFSYIPYYNSIRFACLYCEVSRISIATNTFLTPIVSLLLSYLLLDELPTTLAIIGGIITLLGVSLSNFFQNT